MSVFTPADYDIYIHEGARFEDEVHLYSKTAQGTETLSVAGHAADMHVRRHVADAAALLVLSTTNGRIIVEAPNIVRLLVPDDAILALAPWDSPAVYDLRLVAPDGKAFFVLRGKAWFVPRVTH